MTGTNNLLWKSKNKQLYEQIFCIYLMLVCFTTDAYYYYLIHFYYLFFCEISDIPNAPQPNFYTGLDMGVI